MTRHANLKTVSALTALALTAMLATSAWANGLVYQIDDRNASSVSVTDVVAPLAAVTSGSRWFTKRLAQRRSASQG